MLGRQGAGRVEEDGAQGVMRSEQNAHAAAIAQDGRADLEQLYPDRSGGRPGQFGTGQGDLAQTLHQRISECGEHQAQSVGEELVAAGARAEEVKLSLLDAILGLAALAIEIVVERVGGQVEIGDDKARVGALAAVLQTRDDTALDVPLVGGIAKLADHALLDSLADEGGFEFLFPGLDVTVQAGIARDTDDVADAAAFAPADQALAAETGIAADDEANLRPGLTQACDE